VRETEKIVEASLGARKRLRKGARPPQLLDLETRLRKRLGTKVTILPRGQGGKIVIHYFSPQTLDGIAETLLS
jgi:ParB family chromosome partitioning protein